MAFKMKGSSLYGKVNLNRGGNENRPDGRAKSSAFQKELPTVTVSGGDKTERHADKFGRVKKESTKGNDETRTAKFAAEYGGTWTKQGNVYRNQDGQSVKEAAIAQGQKKSQEKRDYVAENTTKKPGAPMKTSPMTDKPKHQKGGSYTYKGKTYAEFSKLPDEAKQQIYAKNAPNQELAKKVYGIKDENRDKDVAKKPGAPAIWPFKKKVKTSGAVLDRERKKKSRGKKIRTRDISKPSLSVRIFGSGKKKNKKAEPDKKRNIPGFNS